jgi:homoserine kinase type II
MLYAIAIALNDWCSTEDGALDPERGQALLAAYTALRPFSDAERALWPTLLRVACVRFWLSRAIAAQAFAGQDVLIHDPEEFRLRLERRQEVKVALPGA